MPNRRIALTLSLLALVALDLRAVTPISIGPLLQHRAHYFDLEHRRLRFTPRAAAAYDVTVAPFRGALSRGNPIGKSSDAKNQNWRTALPFSFPFGGKQWNQVYINLNGNLTFGAPERDAGPEPETWPEGTMRWLASAFERHALAGERLAIVPLWGLNSAEKTHIFVRSTRTEFTVTWQTVRHRAPNEGYEPLGESWFQARLGRDGSIEFRYGSVAEKDGIVGVFCGSGGEGKVLDRVQLPAAANPTPGLDLRAAEVDDRGADLHFSMTLAGDALAKSEKRMHYAVVAVSQGEATGIMLAVDGAGRSSAEACLVTNAQDDTTRTDCSARSIAMASGRTIDFYLPKIALKDPAQFEWRADIAMEGQDASPSTGDLRKLALAEPMVSGFDFGRPLRGVSGSLYEIFHYPFVPRSRHGAFQWIYRHAPAEDEMALAVTDFRIDDIHDHGASNSAEADANEQFGSAALHSAAGPIFIGPRFSETVRDGERTLHNYAYAVGWIAHEMTHRWVATLLWKEPNRFALLDFHHYHWSDLLAAPVVTPVWPLFSDTAYPEHSVMGGMAPEMTADGHGHSLNAPWGAASGLSALDLFSMGLMTPEEVPETFFISGAVAAADGAMQGGEAVPVRIADIVAVNGARVPAAKDAPRRFRFQIYLLHEDGREPDPAKLAQAHAIEAMVAKYFALASGGRMTVVPTR